MKILFMGTPDFAAASLEALSRTEHTIVGVVTGEDKPQGRGYKLTPTPVKTVAEAHGYTVYQPRTLRDEAFAQLVASLEPDIAVVVAYGKILPKNILNAPKFGCLNVHGSILPEYRGAAPMQRAVIDGKRVTGISTMRMDEGLDTGDVYMTCRVPIGEDDDFGIVHDKMAAAGADLLVRTLEAFGDEPPQTVPQSELPGVPSYAKKIEKEDRIIDFSLSAKNIHNLIRALSPAPLATTHTPDGKLLKIISSRPEKPGNAAQPGKIVALDGGAVTVACGDGKDRIAFTALLPEGKGRMSAADFVRGRRVAVGDVLS